LAKASAAGQEGSADAGVCAHSTKMKDLLKLLKNDMADGQRAVVFSQWTSFLDLVGSALEAASIPFQRFDGSLSLDERAKRVAWLSEEDNGTSTGRVLMVSLKAGGSGLNLVAASRLYLLDLWWNPAVEEQAIQRVHRIGQKQEVHVYKFVVEDSIDMDLLDLHRAKERLLEDALQGGKHQEAATKLTMDDLKRLFNPCRSSLRGLRSASTGERVTKAEPGAQMEAEVASVTAAETVHSFEVASVTAAETVQASTLEPPAPMTSPPKVPPSESVGMTNWQADSDVEMDLDAEEEPSKAAPLTAAPSAPSAAGGWRASMLAVPAASLAQASAWKPAQESTSAKPTSLAAAPAIVSPLAAPVATQAPSPASPAPLIPAVAAEAALPSPASPAPPELAVFQSAGTAFLAPAWEALGSEPLGSCREGGSQAAGASLGFDDDDDLSDSDLLEACEQAEAVGNTTSEAVVSAPSASQAAACWAAMPLDDES